MGDMLFSLITQKMFGLAQGFLDGITVRSGNVSKEAEFQTC